MRLLETEKKEHDRQAVIDYQKQAYECRRAFIEYPENELLRAAMQLSRKRAAKAYGKFVGKWEEEPVMPVYLEDQLEGF